MIRRDEQQCLRRLLEALPRRTVYRLARSVYSLALPGQRLTKARLVPLLLASPQADPLEVVAHVLRVDELRDASRRLGLHVSGPRDPLVRRLKQALRWRSFASAREYAQSLQLDTLRGWQAWCRTGERPPDVPSTPSVVYAEAGWMGWGDFLGTGRESVRARRQGWVTFSEARRFVRSLGLRSRAEWIAWRCARRPGLAPTPRGIPGAPDGVYRGRGWAGWGDYLGTHSLSPTEAGRRFRRFGAARGFVRALGLASTREWNAWSAGRLPEKARRPADIPAAPDTVRRAGVGRLEGLPRAGAKVEAAQAIQASRRERLGDRRRWPVSQAAQGVSQLRRRPPLRPFAGPAGIQGGARLGPRRAPGS